MFVKNIHLKNFKSFRNTKVLFEKGFNAVVGPNGSGKSNIIDSLLFAFGESSLRAMRVKKTTDLIFSKHSVAEVTVHLEGHDKSGNPTKHEVKRLIRKDGKTKYVMDGKKTQRYNVQEFLSHHHLSLQNIIKQGEVQRIVEMNAKDRRGLVDTVANVSEYESKKREALSELNQVENKLKEARILLDSRAGYLEELSKEKQDAEKYLKIKAEVEQIKVTLLSIDVKENEIEFENLVITLADANNKIDAAKARMLGLQNEIDRLANAKDAVNKEIMASGEGKQMDLQKEIDELNGDVVRSKAIIDSRADALNKGQARLKEIEGELTKAADEVKGYERQLGENATELTALQGMLVEAQAEYQKLMQAKDKFSSNFYDMQKVVHECEERQLKIKEELSNLQAEVAKNGEIKKFKENELDKLQRGAFGTSDLDEKRKDLGERKKTAKEEGKGVQKQIDGLFAKEKAANERINTLDELLVVTREKVTIINSRLKHAGGDSSSTKSQDVMDDFAKKNKGVRGRLEALIKYDPEYGVPVQVALGARSAFYVVDAVKTASLAIETLKASRAGRVSFIPLDKIRAPKVPDEFDKASKADGCLGPLTDFIEYGEGIGAAIRYAVGDTLLFQSLASAEKWVGKGVRIVTLDGSLVEASGLMTGGTSSFKINAAMEKQSLAEWETKLEEYKKEKDSIMADLYALREEAGKLRKEKARTDLAERSVEIELEQIDKQEETLMAAKENLSATVKALKGEIRDLEKATNAADEGRATLVRELSELNVKLLEAKSAIDVEKQEQYGNMVTQKERRISEIRVSVAEYENAKRSLETQREVYGKQSDSFKRQMEQVREEFADAERLTKENKALITEKQKLLKVKTEEQRSISGALKKLIDSRTEFDAKIAQVANERGKIEFEKEKVEKTLGDKAIKRAILEERLSTLKAEFGNYPNAVPLQNKTTDDKPALLVKARELDGALSQLGNVNLKAVELFEQKTKELEAHRQKVEQIANEKQAVITVIDEIERKKIATFMQAYDHINENFKRLFKQVFTGDGKLYLENPENPFEGGLTIEVKLENKEVKYLELMSGGEKSLVALMFLFSLQAFNPSSIYILDEADAALDAENSRKLGLLVKELSKDSQMLMVSHNQNVYSTVDCIIGVAMGKDGSQLVEVKIDRSSSGGQKHLRLSDIGTAVPVESPQTPAQPPATPAAPQ